LYGAYHLSAAENIIGVEINEDLCKLVKEVLTKRNMLDRVEIITSDICDQAHIVSIIFRADFTLWIHVFNRLARGFALQAPS